MKEHISTVKAKIVKLVSDRSASQRVAAGGMVFLCLIVISLLFGYEQDAEQYAIWLYYALVVSVLLGLTEDVRTRIFTYIQKNILTPVYLRGRDRVSLAKQNINIKQHKNIMIVWGDKVVLSFSQAWTWLQVSYTPINDSNKTNNRKNTHIKSTSFSVFYVCVSFLMSLLGLIILSSSLRIQMLQLLLPDMFADVFSQMSDVRVYALGTSIWVLLMLMCFYFLFPLHQPGFSRSHILSKKGNGFIAHRL